jgi:hypothetical protein
LILTLGAGDIGAVADQVRERLAAHETPAGEESPGGEGDQNAG